jgi:hypothetical protein
MTAPDTSLSAMIVLAALACSGCVEATPTGSSPPVPLEVVQFEIEGNGAIDKPPSGQSIGVSAPFVVYGSVRSATRPNRGVYVMLQGPTRSGRPSVYDSSTGSWSRAEAIDIWECREELKAPARPGKYEIIVRYGQQVIHKQDIYVE